MKSEKKLVAVFAVLTVINVGAVGVNVASNMAPSAHRQVATQNNHVQSQQKSMWIQKKKEWYV
ncbi:MAG TPA: hypothetical protein VM577_14990 [Anaerovoracaceae bacterium]|nr:hypothetical protein [Anaerovoracaceae bacterium]